MLEPSFSFSVELPDCPAKVNVACSPFSLKQLTSWTSWLRAEEIQRVSTYRRQLDKELFIARRGLARENISRILNIEPSSIQFSTESMGKLCWASDDLDHQPSSPHPKLDFSISKTSWQVASCDESIPCGLVAMAACESERVGVDIETLGALPELEILAMQNLHPLELKIWHQIPQRDRTLAYYQLWVVKEAFVKAIGLGLSQPPNSILSIQALTGRAEGTVAVVNDEMKTCSGRYWLISIGEMQRLAVVTLHNGARFALLKNCYQARGRTKSTVG